MSRETDQWLNTMTVHGFGSPEYNRPDPWHRNEKIILEEIANGGRDNLFPGPVPAEVVVELFGRVKPRSIPYRVVEADGTEWTDPDRQVIVSDGFKTVLGNFKKGYRIHDGSEWGVQRMEEITASSATDESLAIASAGLLKGGAVCWVQAELPDTIVSPAGVAYRPFINFSTSLDGSISSQYWTGAQIILCDNTLSAGLAESTPRIKFRHTKNSLDADAMEEVRNKLEIIHNVSQSFERQLDVMLGIPVSEEEWTAVLDIYKPVPENKGAGQTRANNVRNVLNDLYFADFRVAPFNGTAFGVLQAINTYTQHEQSFKSSLQTRAERNALAVVEGTADDLDRASVRMLNRVFESKGRELITL